MNNRVTSYDGIAGFYFRKIIEEIIAILKKNTAERSITVLDFGCGRNFLKNLIILNKLNKKIKVIGFDINQNFSDISCWKSIKFDYFVANHVFYLFTKNELNNLIKKLQSLRPGSKIIFGCSNQNLLNKIGMKILSKINAHDQTKLSKKQQLDIILQYSRILMKVNVFFLTEIYLLEFKNNDNTAR